MFKRWAHIVISYPKQIIAVSLLVLLAAGVIMATVTPNFDSEGYVDDQAESMQVHNRLISEYGLGGDTIVLVFTGESSFGNPESLTAVDTAVAGLENASGVATVLTPNSTQNPEMVSASGEHAIVIVPVQPGFEFTPSELHDIETMVDASAASQGLIVEYGGTPFVFEEINQSVESGLIRAELVAIPLTLIVLVVVFGSLVSAAMPLMVGVTSIITGVAAMSLWSSFDYQSVFAMNMVTMLGLGLGIDYSLFLVTRYREELKLTNPENALLNSMTTVGKAVFFSGVTVMIGLGATMFFELPALQSLGQAGMVVTASSMFFGLTLLPATLRLLGPRINAVPIGRKGGVESTGESAFWMRVANVVMKQPVGLLIACLAILGTLALPAFNMSLSAGGPDVLPANAESRRVSELMLAEFSTDGTDAIYVIVNSTDENTVAGIQERISAIDHVEAVVAQPGTSTTLLQVHASLASDDAGAIVADIRDMSTSNVQIQVGGAAAESHDNSTAIREGLVPAALFVGIAGYLVLLLTFGSLLLPIKAMFMGALSIVASLGVVVWVFQDGHFESLLNFSSSGMTISMVPVLIACVLFGLSMDYEVLLLSRIQEEYEATGDNAKSVATGLAHTGQVVSGAATIMVIVFAGFVLADVLIIKSLGFGLAFAVLLDATLVRGVLVPSTMRLMGRWNWWAPAPIKKWIDRIGVSHVEKPDRSQPTMVSQSTSPFGAE